MKKYNRLEAVKELEKAYYEYQSTVYKIYELAKAEVDPETSAKGITVYPEVSKLWESINGLVDEEITKDHLLRDIAFYEEFDVADLEHRDNEINEFLDKLR